MMKTERMVPGDHAAVAYLDVTPTPDGRYCVVFNRAGVSRRSYASSLLQVVSQAQRAGVAAVRTDDPGLRQRCEELGLALLDRGEEV
jgi:acetamidase/formamidase